MTMPARIGRYIIKEQLGQGGMAVVYRAYDPQFETDVALKLIRADQSSNTQFRERFKQEAQTLITLHDSAIVPVYNFDEHDGQLYMVMRFMPHGTLKDRLDAHGPMTLNAATEVVRRLAPALDKAHRLGIIHRDIKPSNILFDDHGDPYLSDFGIARQGIVDAPAQTATVIGTPEYMAPEQLLDGKLSQRSDIYQLGVTLFQMLTARIPYSGSTGFSVGYKHVSEPIPSVEALNPALPPGTDAVVARSMAKQAEQRYPTAGALLADLDGLLSHQAGAATMILPQAAPPLTAVAAPPVAPQTPPKAAAAPPAAPRARRTSPLALGGAVAGIGAIALLILAFTQGWIGGGRSADPTPGQGALLSTGASDVLVTEAATPTDAPTATAEPTATPEPTVTPTPEPVVPAVAIRDVTVEEYLTDWGEWGYNVVVDFSAENLVGAGCQAVAYFYTESATSAPLQDFNDAYTTADGQVSSVVNFTPSRANATYTNTIIYIPLSELHLMGGTHALATEVAVICDGQFLDISARERFEVEMPEAWFSSLYHELDVVHDGADGIEIHADFQIDNHKDADCTLNAYFYDYQFNPLRDFNQRYYDAAGQVSTWDSFQPGFDSTVYEDFILFLPYAELHLVSGTHDIYYDVEFFCNDVYLGGSDYLDFTVIIP